jgi:hypothetical protein
MIMVTVPKLIDSLQRYVDMQIEEVARTNPMIGFMKPLVKRAAGNAISKADKMLVLLADKDGNIDINEIMSEMIESLMTTQPFTVNTSFIGDIVIGNGNIKVGIPFTERNLVFNVSDLQNLREMLTIKG